MPDSPTSHPMSLRRTASHPMSLRRTASSTAAQEKAPPPAAARTVGHKRRSDALGLDEEESSDESTHSDKNGDDSKRLRPAARSAAAAAASNLDEEEQEEVEHDEEAEVEQEEEEENDGEMEDEREEEEEEEEEAEAEQQLEEEHEGDEDEDVEGEDPDEDGTVPQLGIKCENCAADLGMQLLAALDQVQKSSQQTAADVSKHPSLHKFLVAAEYEVDSSQQALAGARGFYFQYLHSIRHWCRTNARKVVVLEHGQDVDVVETRMGGNCQKITQKQYKHEKGDAAINRSVKGEESGGFKCLRNAVYALQSNKKSIAKGTKEFVFEYITVGDGTKVHIHAWISLHDHLQHSNALTEAHRSTLHKLHKHLCTLAERIPVKSDPPDLAFRTFFTGSEAKTRKHALQLIKSFSWKLNTPSDLTVVKQAMWDQLKDVYADLCKKPMVFNEVQEKTLLAETEMCLVGEILSRIAKSEGEKDDVSKETRTLRHGPLQKILLRLRDRLEGNGQAWLDLCEKHKDTKGVLLLCQYAAQYSRIADKAAAISGFGYKQLLYQYRRAVQ